MQKVLTAEQMREVDRQTVEKYGIPFILLMENAAHAAARVIAEKLGGSVKDKSFLILCGKGNNGGDGAALARILWTNGASVDVYLFGKVEETKGEARTNFEIAKRINEQHIFVYGDNYFYFTEVENVSKYFEQIRFLNEDVTIDALFGTGLTRKVEGDLANVIGNICHTIPRGRKSFIVSLDLPSGLNADSPRPFPIRDDGEETYYYFGSTAYPDLTITFTAPKVANVLPPAARFNGELVVANIGSPQELIDNQPAQLFLAEKADAQNWLKATKFTVDSYKNARGHALVVAGSKNMSGAAVLCANAAMVSGAGLVTVATPQSAQNAVASRVLPEVMVAAQSETENGAIAESAFDAVVRLSEKTDVAVVGCGLSSNEETTKDFVRKFVENRKTSVVLDADGLNALAPFNMQGSNELPLVLTPHIGEMRRLIGVDNATDLSDRVKLAREFANKHRVILVLKGERSLIAHPDGKVVINPTGNAGLGKAGNGDTLAGIIAGFVAQTLAAEHIQTKIADNAVVAIETIFDAVVAALYIAGLAGDHAARKFGMRSMTASNVRECLIDAFRELSTRTEIKLRH